MRNFLLFAMLMGAVSATTLAEDISFEVGAYAWQENISGDVTTDALSGDIDVEKDLGFDHETNNVFYAVLEHSLPFIPNIRVQQTDLELSATNNASFDVGGLSFSGPVSSSIDLSHTDITLYYKALDDRMALDLGITVRLHDDVSIESTNITTGATESIDADGVLPLLYVAARYNLPHTGLYIGADFKGIDVNEVALYDYRVNLGYERPNGLGLEVGYRRFDLDYDDDDDDVEIAVDGAYIGIFYHF
ncbi:MAG: TIGR04219 family outer membrane beta-barrel protein [Candidatus Reddybacter sp.]